MYVDEIESAGPEELRAPLVKHRWMPLGQEEQRAYLSKSVQQKLN